MRSLSVGMMELVGGAGRPAREAKGDCPLTATIACEARALILEGDGSNFDAEPQGAGESG